MGANWVVGSDGKPFDCDTWSGLLQGVCWNPLAPGLDLKASTDAAGATVYQPVLPPTIEAQQPVLSSIGLPSLSVIALALGLGVGGAVLLGKVI